MKRQLFLLIFIVTIIYGCEKRKIKEQKPALVVGIVVDQMRFDYLTKYADRYGEHGFKKLLNEGFSLTNAHFNHSRNLYCCWTCVCIYTEQHQVITVLLEIIGMINI